MSKTIAILLTVFNRKECTLKCLRQLTEQTLPDGVTYDVYITDGGSTISSNASEKAVEWMKEHPEFGQARASLMLEWQKTHPDEILKIRRENIKKATEARKKRVQCVETGEIFESASEAARKIPGTTQSKICMVCRG